MQKIQITEAKRIAERVGARAVVVLAFDGERFAATSYGATRGECAVAGRWMDMLVDQLCTGKLEAPALK